MAAYVVAVGNRRRDEIFPNLHRVRQIVAERQRRANRGGISATGAVRGNAPDKRRGKQQFRSAVKEDINSLAGIIEMAALHQNRAAESGMDFMRGGPQILRRRDFLFCENFRLVQIWRGERGERQKFFAQNFFRRRLQQPRAAGGNHHWIHDEFCVFSF